GCRRRARDPHPGSGGRRAGPDRAEDVRRRGLPRRRQHGSCCQRPGRVARAGRPGDSRRAGGRRIGRAHGDARPTDAGLASRRARRAAHRAPAGDVGRPRDVVRSLAARQEEV
ncbi:MAG: FIG00825063: hypothetical protein, partial [uncultured Acidimicrobiales bacterium]